MLLHIFKIMVLYLLFVPITYSQNVTLDIGDQVYKSTFSVVDGSYDKLRCSQAGGNCGGSFVVTSGISIDNRINHLPPAGAFTKADYFLVEKDANTVEISFLAEHHFFSSYGVYMPTIDIGDKFYIDFSSPTRTIYNINNQAVKVIYVTDNKGNKFNVFISMLLLSNWDGNFLKFSLDFEFIQEINEDQPQIIK